MVGRGPDRALRSGEKRSVFLRIHRVKKGSEAPEPGNLTSGSFGS
jgi:hypothetical protein